ncbi:glycosyltransferase [Acidithiobacillus montserratensis]|uniref:Glycosyltransferase n=1 Tax=Acidithiobacillus montserratensis TaxID=2729135 RepID=A0ACD5HCK0_9PROT|nr:glycosyltransferase [Acidithiobacillus montserratensis]MBN2679704.1 glycosyltransferase [Acidithiobacillaceae bacterium]MBU2748089.1 glycosyltransferase [Acidithiobacillus montserratensis]
MSSLQIHSNDPSEGVVVVIVTYGDRRELLLQVLDALPGQGVDRVVVVDNGARWSVKEDLSADYGDFLDVVEMSANTGSAKGFATGIQRALNLGSGYIWLLDDDNRPRGDTLPLLREAYAAAAVNTPRDRLAVVAFRAQFNGDLAMGVATHRINPPVNSFHGFHVRDIPYKLWRRTPWGSPHVCGTLPATVRLDATPYSGLLFNRDLIEAIGLPNEDFVLYEDDIEFTHRITQKDGKILLLTNTQLDDIESSWWNVGSRFRNSFVGLLKGEGDFRAFYGMRNRTYFDSACLKRSAWIFWVNRTVYMIVLFVFATILHRKKRFGILRQAVKDGLSGRLGMHKRHPL